MSKNPPWEICWEDYKILHSCMSTVKKALLVGINYTNVQQRQLHGCIDDIVNINELLVDNFNYDINNIIMLRDDNNNATTIEGFSDASGAGENRRNSRERSSEELPTRINILTHLSNLVKQSANLSEIWFHYSGHGSQINAVSNGKYNNLNEVILPVDYQTNGFIIDDEIYNIIKNVKCKMILVFDSCHSGSICELQWSFLYTGQRSEASLGVLRTQELASDGRPTQLLTQKGALHPDEFGSSIIKSMNSNKSIANPNIFCLSSCKDSQTCADAFNNIKTQGVGVFTDSLIHCLRTNHMNVDVLKLYNDICVYIASNGFTQTPLLSCSSDSPGIFTRTK